MLLGACCLLALLSRLLKRNEPTKLTTGGCSFRRAFGTKYQTEIKSCFEHSLSRPSSVSPPWYLRKAVLLLKAGGAPSTAVAARIAIQHIQTVSFGRQRCWGLLWTEFVAAVTSVEFPPLQNPASYNLDQVMQQVREKCESRGRIAGVEQPRRSLRTPSWGVLRELDEVTATLLGIIAMSGYGT
jgi:hypothetical protein